MTHSTKETRQENESKEGGGGGQNLKKRVCAIQGFFIKRGLVTLYQLRFCVEVEDITFKAMLS